MATDTLPGGWVSASSSRCLPLTLSRLVSPLLILILNEDDLTPLDIAVMSNHVPMVKMLLTHGAMENPVYLKHIDQRAMKLVSLMSDAEKHLSQLQDVVSNGGPLNTVVTTQKEMDQRGYWEFKQKLLKRMKEGFDQARQPEPPTKVTLSVANSSSLLVRFDEPLHHNGAVVTRYKVQWSCHDHFCPLAGEQILDDLQWPYYEIPHLEQGKKYFVRVFAWNMKGFSEPVVSNPPYAVPSSWREVDDVKSRLDGKLEMLDNLFASIKNSRPADASEIKMKELRSSSYSPLHPRKSTMRKSLKHLFSASPKFQKTLRRGIYLSCLLYNEDRILVTNEDNLPIVEVDESFSSTNLQADFHWLMKVACTWDDVKSLRQDMAKNLSSSVVLFRSKLLQAVMQLQSALGIKDLGQFYHEATRDLNGSIILTTVHCVRDPRTVNMTHVKWGALNKLHKKVAWTDNSTAPERLLLTVPEMIRYENASGTPLPRGLYLCYLKLKSSVDLIRIMVPQNKPNVLPYVQVRNNPCVTREEWEWVRGISRGELPTSPPSEVQASFLDDLTESSQRLLKKLGVAADDATNHRLYDLEVIELNEDVSCILMLPPVESSTCGPTSQSSSVDTQRLSSILEMDMNLAQQALREAFSSDELADAKQRVEQVSHFQQTLDESWKAMRWTMDIIGYARDKNARVGLSLLTLTAALVAASSASPNNSPSSNHRCLDKISSSSDVTSLSCSDNGYHSDRSLTENNNAEILSVCATGEVEEVWTRACAHMGMLMVYPAYEMGLTNITCVTLHVTSQTTARDVVQRVVHHVNQAVRNKGLNGPFYPENQLGDFCLVAVVGARERVLRDDFQPLALQAPWTMGRLYVRLKGNLLAALERSQVTSV
ncbi:hypothetical protein NP493_40g01041 [Ridgeia piscesae]|uniref:Ankyrin repeat and fibronectin type-III domain-containing protein 1 n=1 Tax=Ridgeia piscesae TaxID=27915 RepID=A0AAD9UJN3_RIDPI|nr:hypothetical protein NP493_40g01041 [Ridgeia piscesae]